jgi:hypothetical protein
MFEYNFPIGYKANIHYFECAFIIIHDWWLAPSMFLGPFMLIRPNNAPFSQQFFYLEYF